MKYTLLIMTVLGLTSGFGLNNALGAQICGGEGGKLGIVGTAEAIQDTPAPAPVSSPVTSGAINAGGEPTPTASP